MILKLAIYTASMIIIVASAGVGFLHWMDTSWLSFMAGILAMPLVCTGSALSFHRAWDKAPLWTSHAFAALARQKRRESRDEVIHAGMQMAYCPVNNRRDHRKKLR